METVQNFKTYDSEIHRTEELANRHLVNKYAGLMSKVQHGVCSGNLKQIGDFVDNNLHIFSEMIRIKDDSTSNDFR